MGQLKNEVFICLDCESTGLDEEKDRIIEFAAVKFTMDKNLESLETLIDPEQPIPELSQTIHHISDAMVLGKPLIRDTLPEIFSFIKNHIIVGHKIGFDLSLLHFEAEKVGLKSDMRNVEYIDTLRLARLYGQSPTNSLEKLREHFNIPSDGAHRAMNDVRTNIEVFKHLSNSFKTTESLFKRLEKPIKMKKMPLGKHKGRRFEEIPVEYLRWAANKDFDQDLLYSLRSELNKRKHGTGFEQASNPFSAL